MFKQYSEKSRCIIHEMEHTVIDDSHFQNCDTTILVIENDFLREIPLTRQCPNSIGTVVQPFFYFQSWSEP